MMILLVIISLSLLIMFHELGHFSVAKWCKVKVEEFGIGFPPRLFGKKRGETMYSVNALPFGGFVKITGENGEELQGEEKKRGFEAQPVWKRSAIVLAGVFMNMILGWLLFSIIFMLGAPKHLAIGSVASGSPAEVAGLRTGDIVVNASYGTQSLADPVNLESFVSLVKSSEGHEMQLIILRGKESLTLHVAPRMNPPAGEGALGVGLGEMGFEKKSLGESVIQGGNATMQSFGMIVGGFFSLVKGLFINPKVIQSVSGPVGIFSIALQAGALGIPYFLQLMALISINLAVLNLLPFPALDGGRFFFLLLEKIKGSPISEGLQRGVNGAGFAVLIILMIVVTVQDVAKLLH